MDTSRKSDREAKYSLIEIRSLTVHRQTKILLQSKWVHNYGFKPYSLLKVSLYKGRIVIKNIKKNTTYEQQKNFKKRRRKQR